MKRSDSRREMCAKPANSNGEAAAQPVSTFRELLDKEPQYVTIPVKLSGRDMKNIERIVGAKFEVLEDATLAVRVRLK